MEGLWGSKGVKEPGHPKKKCQTCYFHPSACRKKSTLASFRDIIPKHPSRNLYHLETIRWGDLSAGVVVQHMYDIAFLISSSLISVSRHSHTHLDFCRVS